ncbi:MAG: acetolactate synthase small subunit [Oscillospiraceae bacterium]|jgi:acetolactate synthase-1/3 small subunit|nr:acetolactate synthase small subunit [Oscillospiraceae bacterium]
MKDNIAGRTLSVLVENSAGVLTRISGLFSRRGYNIISLAVGETQDPAFSRMTIIVECGEKFLDQIVAQLDKQVCVRTVEVLEPVKSISRELMLIKVKTDVKNRTQVIEIANIFRAHIIDVSPGSLTLEITGEADKAGAIIELLGEFGIIEIARTGTVALERGAVSIYSNAD